VQDSEQKEFGAQVPEQNEQQFVEASFKIVLYFANAQQIDGDNCLHNYAGNNGDDKHIVDMGILKLAW
jgi:hypothetical protein